MASTIHFTSGETVTVTIDAKDVVDELKKHDFSRFVLVNGAVFEIYVASDEVAYVAQIPTPGAIAAWLEEVRRE